MGVDVGTANCTAQRVYIQTQLKKFGDNATRFGSAVPVMILELVLTFVERLGDRQRHLADNLRLTPTHLVLSRADVTRFATYRSDVTCETTSACPVYQHIR